MEKNSIFPHKSINRRVRVRRAADVAVYVSAGQPRSEQGLQRYCVRDLSNKGAFVQMQPLTLYRNMPINLVFALQMGTITKLHHIAATVARVSGDGVGVRFLTSAEKLATGYQRRRNQIR